MFTSSLCVGRLSRGMRLQMMLIRTAIFRTFRTQLGPFASYLLPTSFPNCFQLAHPLLLCPRMLLSQGHICNDLVTLCIDQASLSGCGCGSKIGTPNGTLATGNMDQNLWSPGGLILTHTRVCIHRQAFRTPWNPATGNMVSAYTGKPFEPCIPLFTWLCRIRHHPSYALIFSSREVSFALA